MATTASQLAKLKSFSTSTFAGLSRAQQKMRSLYPSFPVPSKKAPLPAVRRAIPVVSRPRPGGPIVTRKPISRLVKPIKGRISPKPTSMPKGTIKPKRTGVIERVTGVAGALGGLAGKGSQLISTVAGLIPRRQAKAEGLVPHRRRKGLTYNEIKGAVKVLKLVKKFAPARSRFAMKFPRHRHRVTSY